MSSTALQTSQIYDITTTPQKGKIIDKRYFCSYRRSNFRCIIDEHSIDKDTHDIE